MTIREATERLVSAIEDTERQWGKRINIIVHQLAVDARAALAAEESGWRLLDRDQKGAPWDGEPVLLANATAVGEAWFCADDGYFYWQNCFPTDATDGCVWDPTHWQPLPPPPAAKEPR